MKCWLQTYPRLKDVSKLMCMQMGKQHPEDVFYPERMCVVRFRTTSSCRFATDYAGVTVFPAEIIKMLALVRVERQGLIKCVV